MPGFSRPTLQSMRSWAGQLRSRLTGLLQSASARSTSGERPLLLLSGVGPAQIILAECIRSAWAEECAVEWLERIPDSPTDELRDIASDLCATRVIAVGVESVYAADDALLKLPIEGIFLHHELDFRFSNRQRQERLLGAFDACERLWFDSTVAMDKASAHGSDRPHLLIPLAMPTGCSPKRPDTAYVSIIVPQEKLNGAEEATVSALQAAASSAGGQVSVHSVDQLYTGHDLEAGRGWDDSVVRRLPRSPSHLVLVGKSGHHLFTAVGLRPGSVDVFVDATVENVAIARRIRLEEDHVARGAALAERVADSVKRFSPGNDLRTIPSTPNHFRKTFEALVARDLPNWHEEDILEAGQPQFDLFFSVAGIENRSNGARPQRIRAMSHAFEERGVPLVRVTANQNLLSRRMRGALELVRAGTQPRLGYGENSTAPMPLGARSVLESGLKELRGAGLKFGWFVRDFHWLEPASSVSQTRSDLDQLQKDSLAEFAAMREHADVLFAPSCLASQRFDRLLRGRIDRLPHRWTPLPPGIDPANCLSSDRASDSGQPPDRPDPLDIVYAGGLGGVYDLQTAVNALASLHEPWCLHLVVRPEDVEAAHQLTSRITGHVAHITNGEFAAMPVLTGATVGLALLESEYGLASFPLKVMSYLERRMTVAVYRNSSPAEMIESYGAGSVVDRTPDAIKAGIGAAVSAAGAVDWHSIHENESWNSRAETVRNALRATLSL